MVIPRLSAARSAWAGCRSKSSASSGAPFHGLDRFVSRSVWIPAAAIPPHGRAAFDAWGDLTAREAAAYTVWARLRAGVSPARAAGDMAVIGQRLDGAYPPGRDRRRQYSIREHAATPPELEMINTIAGMIMTGRRRAPVGGVLEPGEPGARERDLAIRGDCGAQRARRIALAARTRTAGRVGHRRGRGRRARSGRPVSAGRLFHHRSADGMGPDEAASADVSFEVLAGSAIALLLALLVFGVWPALQGTRVNVRAGFGSGLAATPPKWRLHGNLVAWQVCGCVALLLVAAMAQRVIGAIGGDLPAAGPGGDLAIAQVDFALNGRDESQTRQLVDALLAGLRAQPGIDRVVVSNGLAGRLDVRHPCGRMAWSRPRTSR
jgi:hypothetical protein